MKLIFSMLTAVFAFMLPAYAYAEVAAVPNASLTEPAAPVSLRSARNVQLDLLPEADSPAPDSTSAQDLPKHDLWQRIRGGFAMQDMNSPLTARQEKWYADRPDYVMRMTERAHRYLYYITEEVERRNMPSEIALLPMIESAFNPGAYSTSRASGIWQFIPSTGRNFGMQQNWWYDGRRDIISATNGALNYLQTLHDTFGDWELALAAYNWGENAVQRAQEHNRKRGLPTNYASLKMPRETRNYVPKLLAVKNIISNPASFGLALEDIPDQPYFATVTTTKQIDVQLAARLADISTEEFTALNPGHTRPVILQGNNDLILLPIDRVQTFQENLDSYNKRLVSWQAYQPKKGERLDRLAPRFGLSVAELKSVNSLGRNNISTGQTLLVPANGEDSEADNELTAFNMNLVPIDEERHTHVIRHTLRKGETPARIARRYNVSLASLENSNDDLKKLRPGQTIIIVQKTHHRHHLARSKQVSHKLAQHNVNLRQVSNQAPAAQSVPKSTAY